MGVPILPWEPPSLSHNIYATEVMSCPVVTLNSMETVGNIIDILTGETHNGFPVVDPPTSDDRVRI
jgi:chloride channel 7